MKTTLDSEMTIARYRNEPGNYVKKQGICVSLFVENKASRGWNVPVAKVLR